MSNEEWKSTVDLGCGASLFFVLLRGKKSCGKGRNDWQDIALFLFYFGGDGRWGGKVVETDGMVGSVVVNEIGIGVLTIWGWEDPCFAIVGVEEFESIRKYIGRRIESGLTHSKKPIAPISRKRIDNVIILFHSHITTRDSLSFPAVPGPVSSQDSQSRHCCRITHSLSKSTAKYSLPWSSHYYAADYRLRSLCRPLAGKEKAETAPFLGWARAVSPYPLSLRMKRERIPVLSGRWGTTAPDWPELKWAIPAKLIAKGVCAADQSAIVTSIS